jgi:hypothetical protein
MDKKEIDAIDKLIRDIKENKETIKEDQIYTPEEAKRILNLLKKKRPKIED